MDPLIIELLNALSPHVKAVTSLIITVLMIRHWRRPRG